MKIDFSEVIFIDESRVTFDGSKEGFYSIQTCLWLKDGNNEMVVWWYGLELSIKPILDHSKIGDEVKLNSANYSDFLDQTFFTWYKIPVSQFQSEVCIHARQYFSLLYLSFYHPPEFFEHKRSTGEKIME